MPMAPRAHSSKRTMTTTTMMMAAEEKNDVFFKIRKLWELTSLLSVFAASAIMIGSVGNGVRRRRAVHHEILKFHLGEGH